MLQLLQYLGFLILFILGIIILWAMISTLINQFKAKKMRNEIANIFAEELLKKLDELSDELKENDKPKRKTKKKEE